MVGTNHVDQSAARGDFRSLSHTEIVRATPQDVHAERHPGGSYTLV